MTRENVPTALRTEFESAPIGIDTATPSLRWQVESERRNARQTAARVLVGSTPAVLSPGSADVWDSGKRATTRPSIRYDGPALSSGERYYWTVRIWDETDTAGAWSAPSSWEMGLCTPTDWNAKWIRRPGADSQDPAQFTLFRRSFRLDGSVARARASLTASHQYELSLNGRTLDRGPAYSYPDQQYYRTVDITDALSSGDNVVGIVHTWNGAGQGRPESSPGVLVQLSIEFDDGTTWEIGTDEHWRCRTGPWIDAETRNGEIAEPVEVIDGRRFDPDWNDPGFDDADWSAVTVLGGHPTPPWDRLVAQQTDIEWTAVSPVDCDWIDDDRLVVDFGRIYAGVPVVTFTDGTAGDRVRLRAGNTRTAAGTVSRTDGTQWTDMRFGYIQRDGTQRFRPFNYLGFRYLQIDSPGEKLAAEQIRLRARHTAFRDDEAGRIETANERVNAIVDLARHSARYGCQESFVDTPTREKGQFLADAANVSLVSTRAFGERRLSRRAIEEFCRSHYRFWDSTGRVNAVYPNGDGKRDIPDFTLLFADWLWEYFCVSDDRRSLSLAYPVVRSIVGYIARHIDSETGLVTALSGGDGGPYEEGIVDWPPEMRYGYDRDWPVRTTVNLLCINALRRAESIAAVLGRPEFERRSFGAHRERLHTAVVEHLFDGDLFVDGGDGDRTSTQCSQHANALALATGVVPAGATEAVADHVRSQGMQMGPMMVRWLLEAYDRSGRPEALVSLLTDPTIDGWAALLERGGTFTWESWHCYDTGLPAAERRNRSESHPMGATVYTAIQRSLLGVRITAPRRLEIVPPASGLDSARGRVPTECGPAEISWERREDGFSGTVTVPWNCSATVALPAAPDDTLAIDDRSIENWTAGSTIEGVEQCTFDDDRVVLDVGSGTYQFALE